MICSRSGQGPSSPIISGKLELVFGFFIHAISPLVDVSWKSNSVKVPREKDFAKIQQHVLDPTALYQCSIIPPPFSSNENVSLFFGKVCSWLIHCLSAAWFLLLLLLLCLAKNNNNNNQKTKVSQNRYTAKSDKLKIQTHLLDTIYFIDHCIFLLCSSCLSLKCE